MAKEGEFKAEPKVVAIPIKKLSALEREQITIRRKVHEAEVRRYLAGR